jgi:hypothetical protein
MYIHIHLFSYTRSTPRALSSESDGDGERARVRAPESTRARAREHTRSHAASPCESPSALSPLHPVKRLDPGGSEQLTTESRVEQGGASAGREHGMRAVAHTFACVRTRACLGLQVGVLDVSNNVAMPVPHSRPARNHGVGDAHERGRLDLVDAQHTSLLRAVHHHHRPR